MSTTQLSVEHARAWFVRYKMWGAILTCLYMASQLVVFWIASNALKINIWVHTGINTELWCTSKVCLLMSASHRKLGSESRNLANYEAWAQLYKTLAVSLSSHCQLKALDLLHFLSSLVSILMLLFSKRVEHLQRTAGGSAFQLCPNRRLCKGKHCKMSHGSSSILLFQVCQQSKMLAWSCTSFKQSKISFRPLKFILAPMCLTFELHLDIWQ